MTAAYRLKGLGWFGGVVVVTLGFYLVSLQVAAERKHLDQINAKIRSAERDIRALETEFDTRANLAQLERWNGDTLALVAPTANQFVRDEAQLASIRFDAGDAGPVMQTAALVVPSLPSFTQPQALPTIAAAPGAAPARVDAEQTPVRVAVAKPVAAPAKPRIEVAAVAIATKPALRKAQAMAMLDRSLLSDSTLGDLLSGARAETRRRR